MPSTDPPIVRALVTALNERNNTEMQLRVMLETANDRIGQLEAEIVTLTATQASKEPPAIN